MSSIFLIHGPPQVVALALHRQKHLVEGPFIPRLRASTTELVRKLLTELAAPLADRFIGDDDATGEQELFHIAVAEAKPEIEPDAVADDLRWEAVMLIAISGWCVHGTSMAHQEGTRQVAQQVDNASRRRR
jgi:hypothetical protein